MIIQLESPAIQDRPLLFLVDTGAETSLIRKERLENNDHLRINSEKTKILTGFGDNKTHSTIGNVKIPLLLDSDSYFMTFNVIEGIKLNLDIDGILGRNIMTQGGATINCSTNMLEFTRFGIQLPLLSIHTIEPKTRKVLNVTVSPESSDEGILDSVQTNPNMPFHITTNILVKKNPDNTVPLFVTNSSENTMRMFFPRMKLESPTKVLTVSLLKDKEDTDRKSEL